MADALQRLKAILAEVTDIHRAGAVLDWDQETFMPPGGVHNRAEQLSTLSEVAHRRFTTDEVGRLLDEAEAATANSPFDSDDASLVRVTRRDYDQARKLPPELVAAIAHASASARPHWQKARHEANFALFDELKAAIVPLVAEIKRHPGAIDDGVLHRGFDPDQQLRYALDTVTKLC